MNGQGFTLLTEQDAQVKAGDPLIRFDRDVIAKAGYDDIVIRFRTRQNHSEWKH